MQSLALPLDNIFFPSKIPSQKLLVVLHGRGDSSEGFLNLRDFINIDEMNYLLLDAPFEYFGGRSWYNLPPHQLPGIEYSREVLTELFDRLFEENFRPEDTFLFGFSQGSLLTFEFGGRYEKSFAGYIGISGYIYDTEKLLEEADRKVIQGSWLCTHGRFDNVLAYEISKEQVERLQKGGWNIEFHSYDKEHTIDRDELEMVSQWIQKRLYN
ncbi:MAG: serine esterase [Campylobacterales bacterium]|nr:serine esterase [Campylobacterales bacterium]